MKTRTAPYFSTFQFISKMGIVNHFPTTIPNLTVSFNINTILYRKSILYTCRSVCCLFVPIDMHIIILCWCCCTLIIIARNSQLRHLHRRTIHSFQMLPAVVHLLIVTYRYGWLDYIYCLFFSSSFNLKWDDDNKRHNFSFFYGVWHL